MSGEGILPNDSENINQLALTPEIVKAAYYLLLGRPPENEEVLLEGVDFHKSIDALRENFSKSTEGRRALFELLFRQLPFSSIEVQSKRGFSIYINLADLGVSSEIFLFDEFEPHNERFILDNVQTTETFLDIGANIGWFTLIAAQKIMRDWHEGQGNMGQVIGFEANIKTGKLLIGSVQASAFRDIIQVYNVALAPDLTMLRFEDFEYGNIGGAQVRQIAQNHETEHQDTIKEKYSGILDPFGNCKHTAIPGVPLDALLAEHEQRVGLIKIDVEGSEPYVLKGAGETLARHKPKILIEFHKDKLEYSSNYSAEDLVNQLSELGYSLYDFQAQASQKLTTADVNVILDRRGYYDFLALPS